MEAREEEPQPAKELTLQSILASLLTEHEMMRHLLDDLTQYQEAMQQYLLELNQDREGASAAQTR